MSSEREQLTERRDQALRDLVELDRQVEEGEIPTDVAAGLRARYEATAAAALADLDTTPEPTRAPAAPRRSRSRVLAYAATALGAVLAAAVLLPQSVGERPAGGFVTGNEVTQSPGTRPLPTSELAAAVDANPDAIGMRLALADRYTAAGEYGLASGQYTETLRRDPGNAAAQARFGWLLLRLGKPAEALRYVDRALATDPGLAEALWFKANIQLYGLKKPTAALETVALLRQRQDLTAVVHDQVDELAATARERREAGP